MFEAGYLAERRPCWCSSPTSALPWDHSLRFYYQLPLFIGNWSIEVCSFGEEHQQRRAFQNVNQILFLLRNLCPFAVNQTQTL
jgi:hypothetical protein